MERLPGASAFEVTEARLLIESEAAALAARNITDDGITELEALVKTMAGANAAIADAADEKFHLTIARASNNVALVHTIQSLWRMREEIPEVKATYASVCKHDAEERGAEHQAVFEALKNRDPINARAGMQEHFRRLIESMLETTERQAMAELQQRASESRQRFLSTTTDRY